MGRLAVATLAVLLLGAPGARAATGPRPDQAVLRIGEREARPRAVTPAVPGDVAAGPVRLTILDDRIECFVDASGRPAWTAAAPDGVRLRYLGNDGGETAFFAREAWAPERDLFESAEPVEVERLSLAEGRWLPSLRPPASGGSGPAGAERVRAALCHGGRLVVLTGTDRGWRGGPPEPGPSWRITAFHGAEPEWSRAFPLHWFPGGESLERLPSGLLVCAGPREGLLLLDPETGATIGAAERVWEFRRFASLPFRRRPVLARTPESDPLWGDAWEERGGPIGAASHMPRLLAAPAVLFGPDGRARIFAPAGRRIWRGETRHADLYELNDRLEPVDVLALPEDLRSLRPDPVVTAEAVLWTGRSHHGPYAHKGLTGEPCLLGLVAAPGKPLRSWLRPDDPDERPTARHQPWITVERDPDVPPAACGRTLFRVTAGAWIAEPDDDRVHFPVSRVDPATGAERTLDLVVPFAGGPEVPRDCALSLRSPASGPRTRYRDGTGRALSIRDLEVRDGNLRITIRWHRDACFALAFPLADLEGE